MSSQGDTVMSEANRKRGADNVGETPAMKKIRLDFEANMAMQASLQRQIRQRAQDLANMENLYNVQLAAALRANLLAAQGLPVVTPVLPVVTPVLPVVTPVLPEITPVLPVVTPASPEITQDNLQEVRAKPAMNMWTRMTTFLAEATLIFGAVFAFLLYATAGAWVFAGEHLKSIPTIFNMVPNLPFKQICEKLNRKTIFKGTWVGFSLIALMVFLAFKGAGSCEHKTCIEELHSNPETGEEFVKIRMLSQSIPLAMGNLIHEVYGSLIVCIVVLIFSLRFGGTLMALWMVILVLNLMLPVTGTNCTRFPAWQILPHLADPVVDLLKNSCTKH